jgi:hypothetical protein
LSGNVENRAKHNYYISKKAQMAKKLGYKNIFLLFAIGLFIPDACRKFDTVRQQVVKNTTKEDKSIREATFAGGCFWCTGGDFEKLSGVIKVISGYTGGHKENPSYGEVSSGTTGHVEAIQVYYDPFKITYEELLDFFWRYIDPTDSGGQFVD